MSLLAPAHTDCSSWMCFVGAWGCSAASKSRENHFTGLIFLVLVPKFPRALLWEPAECHNFLQIYKRDFPVPPWCLEHVCILPQGIPILSAGACSVSATPSDPGQGWIPGTAASPSEELRGPRLRDSRVVSISIKRSPAEEIHYSCTEPAKLWCHHDFLLWNNWHHKSPWIDFLFPLRALCMWKWDSSCRCRRCTLSFPGLQWAGL